MSLHRGYLSKSSGTPGRLLKIHMHHRAAMSFVRAFRGVASKGPRMGAESRPLPNCNTLNRRTDFRCEKNYRELTGAKIHRAQGQRRKRASCMDYLVPALAFPLSRYRRELFFEQKTWVAPRAKPAARSTRWFSSHNASIDNFFTMS